jgi:hypothetical protein
MNILNMNNQFSTFSQGYKFTYRKIINNENIEVLLNSYTPGEEYEWKRFETECQYKVIII